MRAILQISRIMTRPSQLVLTRAATAAILLSMITSSFAFAAAPIEPEFSAFWTKFKAAVTKNDKAAVADMTKMPYPMQNKMLNREQFIQNYSAIFASQPRKELLDQKPFKDRGNYLVDCGDSIYVFSKVAGKYLFTQITPDN